MEKNREAKEAVKRYKNSKFSPDEDKNCIFIKNLIKFDQTVKCVIMIDDLCNILN